MSGSVLCQFIGTPRWRVSLPLLQDQPHRVVLQKEIIVIKNIQSFLRPEPILFSFPLLESAIRSEGSGPIKFSREFGLLR
jgi:hypothetical protein